MVSSLPNFSAAPSLPPCNLEAEEAILGAILLDPEAIGRICDRLPPEAFFIDTHKTIYRSALKLHNQAKPTDLMYLTTWLHDHNQLEKIGGQVKLAQLVEGTVSSVNIDRYAELVMEKYIRRQLIQIGNQTVQLAYEGLDLDQGLQAVEQNLLEISQLRQDDETTDSEYQRYCKVIDSIRELELKIADPGYRAWKLQLLAEKFKRSPKQLEDLYFKSLISEENGPLMDFDEMLSKHGSCVREWLLHGFIPKKSTILLHAEGGTGKTRLVYDFMYHLALGTGWNGFPSNNEANKCLIVQTDEPASDMLQALIDRGFDNNLPIKYKTRWTVDHMQSLRKEVSEYRPRFIVIDSLTAVSRHSLFSENDTEYARPVLMFRDIAEEFDCTFIIIHHSNSQGGSRGTRAIFNSVSEVWSLKRPAENQTPDATDRTLIIEKSRSRSPARYRVQFNPEDKSWHCMGKEGEEDNTLSVRARDEIVEFLCKHRNISYEVAEIAQVLGRSQDHLRRCAYELSIEGVISRKRNHKNEAYKYFIQGNSAASLHEEEGLTVLGAGLMMVGGGEGSDPRSPNDHPTITQHDQPANLDGVIVSELADHLIIENTIFETEIEEEKPKTHDQTISCIEETTENAGTVSDSVPEEGVIAPGVERSEEVGEIISTVVQCLVSTEQAEELTTDELIELVINPLYPGLTAEKIKEIVAGVHDALQKAEVRSHDQAITPPVSEAVIQKTKPRKPKEGDRIRHFGGKFGTILKIQKRGLAKYVIQWDNGKPEHYTQKEFNKFDFEVVPKEIAPQPVALPTVNQLARVKLKDSAFDG